MMDFKLIDTARFLGIKMIACTISMDVMGFKEHEFIEDIEFAGVATYLGKPERNVNLFI